MIRYAVDYPAFEGKDLAPKGYLELNPNEEYCEQLVSTIEPSTSINEFFLDVYPNPVDHTLHITTDPKNFESNYQILNMEGRLQVSGIIINGENQVDVSSLLPGMYILQVDDSHYQKFIKF
ncbi:T9SS type A sorting domain-containing protein [Portibacter marinus]|uniref:T9SS type A sorting domain-containing protein n=1 Tax=Portibacter marinus TaxID=2898660 RepID=UPI001F282E9E|nr:T9SS type A sorting domain-containing protein [Portibacter marinus]